MSEVKPSDIKTVLDAILKYRNQIIRTNSINFQELMNFMEPVFKKVGYREPPARGGAEYSDYYRC